MRKLMPVENKFNPVTEKCSSLRDYFNKLKSANPGMNVVYAPHQGGREIERRRRQIEKRVLKAND